MALTVTKQREKAEGSKEKVEHLSVTSLTDEDLADKYGEVSETIDRLMENPVFTQLKLLQDELKSRLDQSLEPTDQATLQGEHYLLDIGACSKKPRAIKDGGVTLVQGFLGPKTFGQIAKVNIGDLEKYLTPDQLAKVLTSETGYTDKRTIKVKKL